MKLLHRLHPVVLVLLALGFLLGGFLPGRAAKNVSFDLAGAGVIPVSHDGRVKPLDSVARAAMLSISGRQTIEVDKQKIPALQWMLEVLTRTEPAGADAYKIFRVDHPQLRALLGLAQDAGPRCALDVLAAKGELIDHESEAASQIPRHQRDAYHRAVLELNSKLQIYDGLRRLSSILPIPPSPAVPQWSTLAQALAMSEAHAPAAPQAGSPSVNRPPLLLSFFDMLTAFHHHDPAAFNQQVATHLRNFPAAQADDLARARSEYRFNQAQLFYRVMILYLIVFLLGCGAWIVQPEALGRDAMALGILAFLAHTVALLWRMQIHGRPPVTDLYSSAIFIGWAAVLGALLLDAVYRRRIGVIAAGVIGFATLVVAHNLATRDTIQAMEAVLDSNFWLATHVVAITLGYSATFLAGILGILYIGRGLLTTSLTREAGREISSMIYGIVCFALFFSFVGTVLGGIWADQSWGRFWGWDPKENGAVLIVLWNAIILHARWGGMIRQRGLACLAVAGNIVTAWSWFGTNLLGVGLHSYGFMQGAMFWLLAFVGCQLVIVGLGTLPPELWRSREAVEVK